jgi:hypothetical protein
MAWAFNKGDLGDIAAVAAVHPDPVAWWTLVEADASDSDVLALASAVLAAYAAAGDELSAGERAVVDQLQRIGDTDPSLEITRIDTDGKGDSIEYQAKARGWIG